MTEDITDMESHIIEHEISTTIKVRERHWADGCRTGVEAGAKDHQNFHRIIDRYHAALAAGTITTYEVPDDGG